LKFRRVGAFFILLINEDDDDDVLCSEVIVYNSMS